MATDELTGPASVPELVRRASEVLEDEVVGAQIFDRELEIFGGGIGFFVTSVVALVRARHARFPSSVLVVATREDLAVFEVSLRRDGWQLIRLCWRWPQEAQSLQRRRKLVRLSVPDQRPVTLRPFAATAWGEPLITP